MFSKLIAQKTKIFENGGGGEDSPALPLTMSYSAHIILKMTCIENLSINGRFEIRTGSISGNNYLFIRYDL